MNLKEIKEMISLMEEHNLLELELEREGLKVRLKRQATGEISQSVEELPTPKKIKQTLQEEIVAEETAAKTVQIKSPMVGTFYRAPAPDAPPFVDIGTNIEIGTVVCIIEAMKLMNEIKSEVKGRIIEILVENGEPVEYNQPLFTVEPL